MERVVGRALDGFPNRMALTIGVVAVAVALLVVVTGISLGLATGTTIQSPEIDYWIVPESANTLTTVVSVEGPQLGDVHARSAQLTDIDGVQYATPVLIELIRVRAPNSEQPEYVLGVGVVPARGTTTVGGVPTVGMTPGDPHFAGGEYDGPLTGEVVLSPAAAELLNAKPDDSLAVVSQATGRADYTSFTVEDVGDTSARTIQGEIPIAVFHLSELQRLTGAQSGDQADQVLVATDTAAVKPQLERVYADAVVVTRSDLATQQLSDSDLPLAVSVTALVVGLAVATLFVATAMGLMIEGDRRDLAVLAALGFSLRSRLLFVVATTLSVTALGGLIGVGVGLIGIVVVNYAATAQFGVPPIAIITPQLVGYGFLVALITGLFAAPYPVAIARRTDIVSELSG